MAACAIEVASFRGDDHPFLVEAALACRVCLSGAIDWALVVREWEAVVECTCRDCGDRRTVSLTEEQALRLALQQGVPG